MSVERLQRAGGEVIWRVRWRDQQGRNRSKVLGRKRDAEAFDADVRRMKRTRELGQLDAGKRTLAELGEEWWKLHAEPNLAQATRETYAAAWDTHVLPRLGGMTLRDLDTAAILGFRVELERDGVGPAAARKALALLHGVLARGVEWGWIASNPAAAVRKPAPTRQRAVTPLPPSDVEAMRAHLIATDRTRDATLLSVLAYAGLRPGEALALTWRHVGRRSLLVDGAVAYGEVGATKTRRTRSVALLCSRSRMTSPVGGRTQADPTTTRSCSPASTASRGRARRTRAGRGAPTRPPPRRSASPPAVHTTFATASSRC